MRTLRLAATPHACQTPLMRYALALILLLPTTALALARADSERYQNNHLSPQSQNAQTPRRWPQTTPHTAQFCDHYARDVSRPSGHNTSASLARNLGYLATRNQKQADAFGIIGGAVGSKPQRSQQQNQTLYRFHYDQCLSGKPLRPAP